MLTYRVISLSVPIYLNSIMQVYAPFQRSSKNCFLALPPPLAQKAITAQTVLVCGSPMVEQGTKCYQSRGVPLYLQETLEDSSLTRAPPLLRPLMPQHA